MRTAILALILLAAGCVSPLGGGERRFIGLYAEGLETMTFTADGQSDAWAANGPGIGALQAAAVRAHPDDGFQLCATVMGRVGPPGRYGHLGMFSREIEITQVTETRQPPCD